MSFPKLLAFFAFLLFSSIAVIGLLKRESKIKDQEVIALIDLSTADGSINRGSTLHRKPEDLFSSLGVKQEEPFQEQPVVNSNVGSAVFSDEPVSVELPAADRVDQLFKIGVNKLPIVETVTYKSKASWMKGRPAWVADYASHYRTSRHFIARSLHGKSDYFKQEVAEGDRFNVYRNDLHFQFNLVIDLSRCRLWLYYQIPDKKELVLIKDYPVGLGRQSQERDSGLLTPRGQYQIGSKVAVFKPGMKGVYNGRKEEMIRIFGTRWLPFETEIGECSEPAKGYGIHGVPWKENAKGTLEEDTSSLGAYTSDGCIHLAAKDMEELFAILVARPAVVELVQDFRQAVFPQAFTNSASN